MITKYEADRAGKPVRVFHRGGSPLPDATGGRYVWTHPIAERSICSACQDGTLPLWVRKEK